MKKILNLDSNGIAYYTDSNGNLIQNQSPFQKRMLDRTYKTKTIAQHLTLQDRQISLWVESLCLRL